MTRRPCPPRGFTLLELLAVMGIMIILMSMLSAVAVFARQRAQIQTQKYLYSEIGNALDAYRLDFGDYPRHMALQYWKTTGYNNPAPPEFRSLAVALIGPCGDAATGPFTGATDSSGHAWTYFSDSNLHMADGAAGPGFRLHLQQVGSGMAGVGKVWGPYLLPDKFNVQFDAAGQPEILDVWGTPIQYFPRYRPAGNFNPGNGYPTPPATNAHTGKGNFILAGPLFGLSSSNVGDDQALFDSRDGNFNNENTSGANSNNVIGGGVVTFPNCVYAMLIRLGDDNCNNFIEEAPAPANGVGGNYSQYSYTAESLRYSGPYILASAGPKCFFDDLTQDPYYLYSIAQGQAPNELDWVRDVKDSTNVYNWDRW